MKMKKKIKAKWVAALRSGDYTQGCCQLRDEANNFCCLGVLCNIHALENPKFAATQTNPVLYDWMRCQLSPKVKAWSGLQKYTVLIDMNDGFPGSNSSATFNEIADYIEENY